MTLAKHTFALSLLLSVLFLSACSMQEYHINYATLEVNPAPEMRGAGKALDSNYVRVSGGINYGQTGKSKVSGVYNEWSSSCSQKCRDAVSASESSQKVHLDYDVNYPIIFGSIEYLLTANPLLLDLGIGINHGAYAFASLGINTKHFEMGFSAGLWKNFREYEYSGIVYENDRISDFEGIQSFNDETHSTMATLLGIYVGLYYGRYGLEISSSLYDADLNSENISELPMISTTYATVSYNLNEHWTLRAGTIILMGQHSEKVFCSGIGSASYMF